MVGPASLFKYTVRDTLCSAPVFASAFAKAENLSSYEGHYGAVYGGAFNDSVAMNNTFDGDDTACVVHEGGGGGPFSDYSEKCVNRGNLYYGWIEDNSSANYFYPSIDMEAGATNFVASILLDQPLGYYFYGAGLAAAARNRWSSAKILALLALAMVAARKEC